MLDPLFSEVNDVLVQAFIKHSKEAYMAKKISYDGGWVPVPGDLVWAISDDRIKFKATYLCTDSPAPEGVEGRDAPFHVIDDDGKTCNVEEMEFIAHDPDFMEPDDASEDEELLPPVYDNAAALLLAVDVANAAWLKNLTAAGLLSLARFVVE